MMLRTISGLGIFLLGCMISCPGWSTVIDPGDFPLQPADTSSPRDTLQSFMQNASEAHRVLVTGNPENLDVLRYRLEDTLDFSATPNSDLSDERILRVIYLKEILDRIELPPLENIPGDEEVAQAELSHWFIPGTRIVITRITKGERIGQYVFSARSIANLHQYFRQVRHLPYQAGASENFYEHLMAKITSSGGTIASRIRSRLKPLDASSPRALIEAFFQNMNDAYRIVMEVDSAFRSSPPGMNRLQAVEAEAQAQTLFDRALATLDMSGVPATIRDDVGVEAVLLLKEILDRAPLPAIELIPDQFIVMSLRESGGGPIRWQFPNTDIEIVELTEGPDKGQFRFSAKTVENAEDSYLKVLDLEYRDANKAEVDAARFTDQYGSPATSPDFHKYYISTPGRLIPAASPFWPLLKRMPETDKGLYFGQTLWQWVSIVLMVMVAILAYLLFDAVGRWFQKRHSIPLVAWVRVLKPTASAVMVLWLSHFLDTDMNITGTVNAAVLVSSRILIYLFAAMATFHLISAVADTIAHYSRYEEGSYNSSILRVSSRAVGFFVGVVILVNGVRHLGLDVMPLLAGLGFGGLAVALAIRPTLENMIGGLILYADRPVKVGDSCAFGNDKGTVERIGLRSTRVRTKDRTVITVPNSVFADMKITNWAKCDRILIDTVIGLHSQTTPDQLRKIMAKMRQTCLAHPMIDKQTLRIRFSAFGQSSLDVSVRVYVKTTDWSEFYAVREDLFLKFVDIIEKAGSSDEGENGETSQPWDESGDESPKP